MKRQSVVRVIINADDLGMTPGVTKGIVESMLRGVVTSSTFMASMPDAENAAAQVVDHGLKVGVHLNLTTGSPLMPAAKIPSLVDEDGAFLNVIELYARLRKGRVSLKEIELEYERQIERALTLGIAPTHVDTHHHMHSWLPVAKVLERVAARHGIRKLRTLRTAEVFFPDTFAGNSTADHLGRGQKRIDGFRLTLGGFKTPLALMKTGAFMRPLTPPSGSPELDDWIFLIEKLGQLGRPAVYEIPCHPGYRDSALDDLSAWAICREETLAVLTSDHLKQAVARSGVRLISYADL